MDEKTPNNDDYEVLYTLITEEEFMTICDKLREINGVMAKVNQRLKDSVKD